MPEAPGVGHTAHVGALRVVGAAFTSRRGGRPSIGLAGALAVLALSAGCTVSVGDPNDDGVQGIRDLFDETQQVHVDLTEPPTREEVGIEPGRSTCIVERSGGDRFLDVELTLPGGGVLDVPAIGVVFTGEGDDALPTQIIVNAVAADVAAAQRAVNRVVALLGLDQAEVDDFFSIDPSRTTNRVFTGKPVGYVRLPEVEVFLRGPDRRVAVNDTLSWNPPRFSAS